jgi:hypothetical protein
MDYPCKNKQKQLNCKKKNRVRTISTIRIKGFYILYMKRDGKVTTSMLAYVPENEISKTIKITFLTYSKK